MLINPLSPMRPAKAIGVAFGHASVKSHQYDWWTHIYFCQFH